MQKLDMSSYGVEELDANEIKNLDGGWLISEAIYMTGGVIAVGIMMALATGTVMLNSAVVGFFS